MISFYQTITIMIEYLKFFQVLPTVSNLGIIDEVILVNIFNFGKILTRLKVYFYAKLWVSDQIMVLGYQHQG